MTLVSAISSNTLCMKRRVMELGLYITPKKVRGLQSGCGMDYGSMVRSKVLHFPSNEARDRNKKRLHSFVGYRGSFVCRSGASKGDTGGGSGANGGGGGSESSMPMEMSLSDAYRTLGLQEGAGYEQVLSAKNSLLGRYKGDRDKCLELEMAYDRIFNSQLQARLSGELPVSASVRYADVAQRRQASRPSSQFSAPAMDFVSVEPLSQKNATIASVIFGSLAAWALVEGLLVPTPAAAAHEVPGLQLALGAMTSVYFLRNEKRMVLYKAIGFTFLGILGGSIIGSGLESWLRVDIVPLGSLSSPGTVVGECALAAMFAVTFLLA